jgi:hypothetical protein
MVVLGYFTSYAHAGSDGWRVPRGALQATYGEPLKHQAKN